ncbi:MAG: GntR family transcriptional regulator / MocR family aminotransferase [Thermoleophilaceae bacterium]|nr:GntR family transcriptional regulator / MocR family aminotransferase [Thermoleophilaceae bacterium]
MARVDQFATTPELLIEVERGNGAPLRAQIERELRDAVRSGRLRAGTTLPSTRALARRLGVSRGVVVEAYAQLVAEGYLSVSQGAPTRVAAVASMQRDRSAAPPAPPPPRYDLRPSVPDLSAFPRRAWLSAERRALAALPHAALDYPDMRGAPELRGALAAYLGRARGLVAAPERIVITTGTLQSVGLIARVLASRGSRRIAMEQPGFHIHRALLRRSGITTVPVPVDDRGLVVERLERTGCRAVLVTPAHQMPLGAVMAPERRAALLDWAERHDALVIEDDYDGEYRYDREPVGALQGLAPERVAYLGSASKVLAPALRIGWVVLPSGLERDLAEEKGWADAGSPLLGQLALADLIERGELDRHLRRVRASYRRRRDLLVAGLREQFPGVRVLGVAAGLHVAVQPRELVDERALVARAAERGVAMFAFRDRSHDPPASTLLLGYANVPEPSIEPALRELRAAY